MYLKCYFATQGNLTSCTVLAPASQTNICSGESGWRGLVGSLKARYRQAVRHMWGSLDSGFLLKSLFSFRWTFSYVFFSSSSSFPFSPPALNSMLD